MPQTHGSYGTFSIFSNVGSHGIYVYVPTKLPWDGMPTNLPWISG